MAAKTKVFICNHQIYLNENQRYDLYACIPVKTTGIFILAEISKNYNTKEISEIFCNYELDCKETKNPIKIGSKKIKISLPNNQDIISITDEPNTNEVVDLRDILNTDEGGREELYYETIYHDYQKNIKTYHKIEIKDINRFHETVEFINFNS
jgi:hypothetical protein